MKKRQEIQNCTMPTEHSLPDSQPNASPKHEQGEYLTLQDMVRPEHFNDAPKPIKHQVVLEQSYGLVTALRYSAFYTIIVSSLSLIVLWPVVPHDILFSWYGVLVTFALGRHWICIQFDKVKPSGSQLAVWLRRLWVASSLVGITWCGLVVLVWPSNEMSVVAFTTFLLASLAFGSYTSLGMYTKIYIGSALPQLVASAILFGHITHEPALAAILCMMLMFIVGVWGASKNSHYAFRSILTFMHQHQDLAQQHREKSAVLSTILHSIGDGVLTVDRNGLVTYLNPSAERLTGLALQDVVGKSVNEGFKLTDDAADSQPVNLALIFKQVREAVQLPGELVLTSLRVRAVSVDVTISPLLYSPETEVDGYVVTLHDVTLQRTSARELSRQALQDPLTGLVNRRGFERRLQEALERQLSSSSPYSLCFIDLDRFKAVNDNCGHQAGDELLKQVTSTVQARMRDSDVFARLGGDEFAVLLCGCPIEKAQKIADMICRSVADYRFDWEGKQYAIGASIGVAPMLASDTLQSITEAADAACYQAKNTGRGRVCVDLRQAALS